MVNRIAGLAALVALSGIGPVSAQDMPDGSYLRVFGGASSILGDVSDNGPMAGAALGVRSAPGSPWAAEIELSRRDGDVEATGAVVNVLRDVADVGNARLYTGLGLGAMRLEDADGDDTNLAGQAILGAGFDLGQSSEFTLELRYVDAGNAPTTNADATWSEISAGLALNF